MPNVVLVMFVLRMQTWRVSRRSYGTMKRSNHDGSTKQNNFSPPLPTIGDRGARYVSTGRVRTSPRIGDDLQILFFSFPSMVAFRCRRPIADWSGEIAGSRPRASPTFILHYLVNHELMRRVASAAVNGALGLHCAVFLASLLRG